MTSHTIPEELPDNSTISESFSDSTLTNKDTEVTTEISKDNRKKAIILIGGFLLLAFVFLIAIKMLPLKTTANEVTQPIPEKIIGPSVPEGSSPNRFQVVKVYGAVIEEAQPVSSFKVEIRDPNQRGFPGEFVKIGPDLYYIDNNQLRVVNTADNSDRTLVDIDDHFLHSNTINLASGQQILYFSGFVKTPGVVGGSSSLNDLFSYDLNKDSLTLVGQNLKSEAIYSAPEYEGASKRGGILYSILGGDGCFAGGGFYLKVSKDMGVGEKLFDYESGCGTSKSRPESVLYSKKMESFILSYGEAFGNSDYGAQIKNLKLTAFDPDTRGENDLYIFEDNAENIRFRINFQGDLLAMLNKNIISIFDVEKKKIVKEFELPELKGEQAFYQLGIMGNKEMWVWGRNEGAGSYSIDLSNGSISRAELLEKYSRIDLVYDQDTGEPFAIVQDIN